MLLKYVGTAHFRELLAEDFKKLGDLAHEAITFARDEVMEVRREVGTLILGNLADEFVQVEADTKTEVAKVASEITAVPAIKTVTDAPTAG